MKKPSTQTIIIAVLAIIVLLLAYNQWGSGIVSSIKYNFTGQSTKNLLQIGSTNAKIDIIEYYSYTCEYCRVFEIDPKPQIIKNYVSTGEARLVFRPVDPDLGDAALCANEQGKFLEYHDSLFRNAPNISKEDDLKVLARNVGMDEEAFWQCYSSGKYRTLVEGWYNELSANFIKYKIPQDQQGTPSFIIGKNMITGVQSYDVFAEAIDKALGK
jgi:protein-disulfide isomerase